MEIAKIISVVKHQIQDRKNTFQVQYKNSFLTCINTNHCNKIYFIIKSRGFSACLAGTEVTRSSVTAVQTGA